MDPKEMALRAVQFERGYDWFKYLPGSAPHDFRFHEMLITKLSSGVNQVTWEAALQLTEEYCYEQSLKSNEADKVRPAAAHVKCYYCPKTASFIIASRARCYEHRDRKD